MGSTGSKIDLHIKQGQIVIFDEEHTRAPDSATQCWIATPACAIEATRHNDTTDNDFVIFIAASLNDGVRSRAHAAYRAGVWIEFCDRQPVVDEILSRHDTHLICRHRLQLLDQTLACRIGNA